MSQDVQSKFKAVKLKLRINMGVQTNKTKQKKKSSNVWYHLKSLFASFHDLCNDV